MNFSELVAAVIVETKRPDMGFISTGGDGTIPQKIAAATLTLHGMDFFYKDIKTAQIAFDTAAYIQTLDIRGIARYRSCSFFRKNDPTLATYQQNPTILPPLFNNVGAVNFNQSMAFLELITPDDVLDSYGAERIDVFYQAGDTLFIKSSSAVAFALFGWYAWPNADPGTDGSYPNYDSWIAETFPFAIIYHASSSIFAQTGKQDQSRKYDNPQTGLVPEQIRNLLISNVTAQGR